MAETVSITLRLFAVFRETLGSGTLTQEVPAGTTVGEVLDRLIAENAALAGTRAAVSFSVNRSYASADTVLHAGDEVAFIPPVSGGGPLVYAGDPMYRGHALYASIEKREKLPLPGGYRPG
ncbi:MAG: MoaD/ThiS family protein [Chloroflexota bacterium]|nr:MoaD/ThiS family protein [Chloroflexota bacterium]MDE2839313.1 MoaD/ThiS family protein [Chloroflexota bacterium]MDE2931332.1 MoaD/ThiS family protein [Chloroflexota bacterium]